ncbi:hypothetical protein EON63_22765 [archaeon]|nr:MAG: hypothetical protein EON63_22765 [archaeon]
MFHFHSLQWDSYPLGELIKLTKKFKVSEKMLGYIKMGVYGANGDWGGLARWGLEKKPAMGYKPLAVMLIRLVYLYG